MDTQPDQESQLIDLREFVGVLRRRKWIVISTTLLVALLAIGLVARRTPAYSASARVEVRPLTADASLTSFYDLQSSMDTEAAKVTSKAISDMAAADGAVPGADVSTSVPANTTFVDISCTTLQPADAMNCANAYAKAYVDDRTAFAKQTHDDATAQPL